MQLLLMYTQFGYLCICHVLLISFSIVIHNKCISVPLTNAHLQGTCSEIINVQPPSCDHTLIKELKVVPPPPPAARNGILSSAAAKV
jgi:hypothetical protein